MMELDSGHWMPDFVVFYQLNPVSREGFGGGKSTKETMPATRGRGEHGEAIPDVRDDMGKVGSQTFRPSLVYITTLRLTRRRQ